MYILIGVIITTIAWVMVTLLTKPTQKATLLKFYRLIRPRGPGWKQFISGIEKDGDDIKELTTPGAEQKWDIPGKLISVFLGCLTVYSALFSIGFWLYSNYTAAVITTASAVIFSIGLIKNWKRLKP